MTLKSFPTELIIWIAGLTAMAVTNPHETHYSFCVFRILGFKSCPGCGLGHSIGFIFRGEWKQSWQAHPLGGLALAVILHRIWTLGRKLPFFHLIKASTHGR